MKKLLLLALAFFSLNVFAQTNLFNPATASVISTWGAGDVNPTASWDAASGALSITLNTAYPGWQWGNQVAFAHGVTFDNTKYYRVSMSFLADVDCGGVTLKIDDASGMIFENQTINLVANTPYNYQSAVVAGIPSNNKMVLDFGFGQQNTNITVSNIVIVEAEAPAINLCEGAAVATSFVPGNTADKAIDGNTGTRWESKSSDGDDVKWQMNLAEATSFNRIKIQWEGAYAKDFAIVAGNDCAAMDTILKVTDQQLTPAQYTQVYELPESVTASHIQFVGIHRATVYGYSFFEFEVYTAQASVLTALDFTAAATISAVNGTVALTATPKDQYNMPMTGTITYDVVPATAGHVDAGVYYADAAGLATITATCGAFSKSLTIFNYEGENVALNKVVTANGFNDAARVNDGNNGTEFQADPNNGGANHDVTCGFTIDLAANYDLNLVTILFEGACSDAYTLETSPNGTDYELAHSYTGTNGINGHTDYLYAENLQNATNVRYLRFTSTKNSTDWGMKIFEFQAFGMPAAVTNINQLNAAEASQKFMENGKLFIRRGEHVFNAQGQLVK